MTSQYNLKAAPQVFHTRTKPPSARIRDPWCSTRSRTSRNQYVEAATRLVSLSVFVALSLSIVLSDFFNIHLLLTPSPYNIAAVQSISSCQWSTY